MSPYRILKVSIFLIVLIILAPIANIFIPPLGVTKPNLKDWFFADVARGFDAPQICDKSSPRAYVIRIPQTGGWFKNMIPPRDWFWDRINRYDYLQSVCYEEVVAQTHDVALCDNVRALGIFLNSGFCSVRDCEESTAYGNTECSYSDAGTEQNFNSLMQALGYSYTVPGDNNYPGGIYEDMRMHKMSGVDEATFIHRVEAMQ